MASTVEDAVGPVVGAGAGEKGLKQGALGLVSSIVVGVASTAPAYSLAASLGYVVLVSSGDGIVGVKAPAIMLLAFLPMYFIAVAYAELNRAEPDCGTTFTWASRAFGPMSGSTASAAVTSVMTARSSPRCRRSHARSRCRVAPGTTSRNAVSDSRVTVTSASIPPRSFSICV